MGGRRKANGAAKCSHKSLLRLLTTLNVEMTASKRLRCVLWLSLSAVFLQKSYVLVVNAKASLDAKVISD